MKRIIRSGMVVAALAGALAPTPARAEDDAAGRVLFEEGRRLMAEGKYAEACPKFEEGQRLSPGVGMRFNQADCYEKIGRTASAWTGFMDAAGMARAQRQPDREKAAKDRAAALEPALVRLKIELAPGAKLAGLEVKRDGLVVGEAQLGLAIPVDPGEHVIAAAAPNHVEWSTTVKSTKPGETLGALVPKLAEKHAAVTPTPTPTPAPLTPAPLAPTPPSDRRPGGTQRILGLSAAGVGVVGLGVGTAFGLMAKSKQDEAASHCVGDVCDADGIFLRDRAIGRANVSTVAFIAGGVFVVGGAVLFFTAPSAKAAAARARLLVDGLEF